MIGIETSFGEHIYEFNGELYKQMEGGAIGVRLTGEVAKIIMDRWAWDMEASLRASKVEIFLFCKYVDDVNLATSIIPLGYAWKEAQVEGEKVRKLEYCEETFRKEKEKEQQESPEERTIRLISQEASRKVKGIKFTFDIPEKHANRKCPVLDLAVW